MFLEDGRLQHLSDLPGEAPLKINLKLKNLVNAVLNRHHFPAHSSFPIAVYVVLKPCHTLQKRRVYFCFFDMGQSPKSDAQKGTTFNRL